MSNQDNVIEISEYELKEIPSSFEFTSEEENIIETDFKDKIKLSYKSGNRCFIEGSTICWIYYSSRSYNRYKTKSYWNKFYKYDKICHEFARVKNTRDKTKRN